MSINKGWKACIQGTMGSNAIAFDDYPGTLVMHH